MNDKLKQQLMDDLITIGECAYKTDVKHGAVTQTYVDPTSDEAQQVRFNNCTHSNTYTFMDGKRVCTDCGKVLQTGNIRA